MHDTLTTMQIVHDSAILQSGGYLLLFLLMTSNGLFSFPSSQFLYIAAGYLASKGALSLWLIVLIGAIGNTLGNIALFFLTKRFGKNYAEKISWISDKHKQAFEKTFEGRGFWFLWLSKLTPALKVFTPIAAGLTQIKNYFAILLFLSTSLIWPMPFIYIGYIISIIPDAVTTYAICIGIFTFILLLYIRKIYISKLKSTTSE